MKEYLEKRGFDEEIIKEWKLEPGNNEVLINYLDSNGNLLYKRKNRPGKEPKYISPSSDKMPDGHSSLYGLNMLKDVKDKLLLIEGEYNCISAWYMGHYALGVPGQVMSLKEYHLKDIPDTVKKITILYDDPKFATERAKEILKYYDYDKKVYIAKYPDSKDANDYLIEGRTIDFKAIVNTADRYLEDQSKSPDIKVKIPTGDFVESYKEYTTAITDAPAKYQELMALSIIATVLGRQVYIPWFNDSFLYPNLYIVLLGKSTVMRKSESISQAIKLIRTINNDRIFPSQFTQEALFGLLQDKPVGIISWAELGGFLAGASKSYMAGTKSFLTELYDCPNILEKKLVSDSYQIENPCINIISGTTIQYFKDWINESDTFGGFYGRFLYMPCTPKDKNGYMPNPLEVQPTEKKLALIDQLKEISEIEGAFKLSEEAKVRLTWWLIKNNEEMENFDDTDRRQSFYGRYDAYLRKFAMLYEISANKKGELIISETSVLRAIKMMNILKEALNKLIGEHFAFTQAEKDLQKVLNIIKEKDDPIPRAILTHRSHMTKKQLNEVLDTLIQSDSIKVIFAGEGRKKTILYSMV